MVWNTRTIESVSWTQVGKEMSYMMSKKHSKEFFAFSHTYCHWLIQGRNLGNTVKKRILTMFSRQLPGRNGRPLRKVVFTEIQMKNVGIYRKQLWNSTFWAQFATFCRIKQHTWEYQYRRKRTHRDETAQILNRE